MGTIGKLMRPQNDPHGINGWIDARMMPPSHGPLYARAVELLDLKPEDDLLEVACGVGALLQRHAGQVRFVAGLDHSQMQVGHARQRLTDRIAAGTAEVVLGDAVALPWQDERFTAVVCLNGLELMPEPQKALSEMRRVLRPGGRAVLTMGMRFTDLKAQKKFADLELWAPTEAEATATVHEAGFADLELTYFKEGSGMLDSLASWLSRTLFGSDEMRLVRAVAGV